MAEVSTAPSPSHPLGSGWGQLLWPVPDAQERVDQSRGFLLLGSLRSWRQMGEQSAGKGYGLMVRKELQTASPRGSQEWQVPCWRSPVGLWPGPCCGHTALLDRTKGCRLFMELGLTPGAASGLGCRPDHLAAGCPLLAQPPTPPPGPAPPLHHRHPWSRPACPLEPPRLPPVSVVSVLVPAPLPVDGNSFFSGSAQSRFPMKPCRNHETWLECPGLPHSPLAAGLFPSVCLLPVMSAVTL